MKKSLRYLYFLFALLFCTTSVFGQKISKTEQIIRQTMAAQEVAWNRADLVGFMHGYWQSDSLKFIGSRGLTYGWDKTLANYQASYPNAEAMGTLVFTIIKVDVLSKRDAYVIGKWALQRKKGDLSGHFTLLWKKIDKRWVIVADHSS